MTIESMNREYFYSCAWGLEPYLKQEIEDFFCDDQIKLVESKGGYTLSTTFEKAVHFSLMTKVSSRFFIKLGVIGFRQEKDIYKEAKKEIERNNWNQYFLNKDRIKINTLFDSQVKTKIKSPLFCSQILKDSLVDHIDQEIKGDPKNSNVDLLQRIEWHNKKNCFFSIIYLDFYRRSLGNRAYKKEVTHIAPLKESLAGSILLSTKWDGKKHLYDPMCGSGTFLIEAFLKKFNLAGQIFHLMNSHKIGKPFFPARRLTLFCESKEAINKIIANEVTKFENVISSSNINKKVMITGSDIFMDNIKALRATLNELKISSFIEVRQSDFFDTKKDFEEALIIFNPPYGERLNRIEDLQEFYHKIGEHLKNEFKQCSVFLLTGDNEIRKSISLQTNSRKTFYNGKIECRLIQYNIF